MKSQDKAFGQTKKQSFSTVSEKQDGYNIAQVDTFIDNIKKDWSNQENPVTERMIRFQAFAPERGGYNPIEVDHGLIRLEQSLAKKDKESVVKLYGVQGWQQVVNNRIAELWPTLSSKKGQKFSSEGQKATPSYFKNDVDKFVESLKEQLFDGKRKFSSVDIRACQFSMVDGPHGYSTMEVDYFLDEVISVFNQLEVE